MKRFLTVISVAVISHCAFAGNSLVFSTSGSGGYNGSNGRSGYGAGTDGTNGEDGDSAQPIDLTFNEKGGQIQITGKQGQKSVNQVVKNSFQRIYVTANGGDGGNGGNGGYGEDGTDGVDGQNGADGQRGYDGRPGADGTRYSPDGEDGQRGGDGSNGENGTDGTAGTDGYRGGNGGYGGDGGSAAPIIIRYTRPETLMQFAVSNTPGSGGSGGNGGQGGRGGKGGKGGRGGSGGDGGWGGHGGRGYRCSDAEKKDGCRDGRDGFDGSNGNRGWDGSSGRDGSDGYNGASGAGGRAGSGGSSASIRYVLVDQNGKEISESSDIYRLSVVSFDLRDENGDGIFAPWEKIYITHAQVTNSGPIAMPAGGQVTFSIEGTDQKVVVSNLPAIPAGKSIVLADQALEPQGLKDGEEIVVDSSVDFRNIPFYSENASRETAIRFPLQIGKVQFSPAASIGKAGTATMSVTNITQKAIGSGQALYSSTGPVKYSVVTDLKALAPGQSTVIVVKYLPSDKKAPKDVQDASLSIQLNVDRHFSGDHSYPVRMVPDYAFKSDSDVLIIGDGMNEASSDTLTKTLNTLLLKHDYYDLDLNGTLSPEAIKKYQKKLVIYLHSPLGNPGLAEEAIQAFARTSGGLIVSNSSWSLAFPSYQDVAVVDPKNVLSLSLEDQKKWLELNLPKAVPFSMKIGKLETYYGESRTLFSSAYQSVLSDIGREYNSPNGQAVYQKQGKQSFAGQLNQLVSGLNVFSQGGFRAALLDQVPALEELEGGSQAPLPVAFEAVIHPMHIAYLNLAAVAKHCGVISGQYVSANNESLWLWKGSLTSKNVKGNLKSQQDEESLSGKDLGQMHWSFSYGNHSVQAQMFCEGDLVYLKWVDGSQTTEFRKLNNRTKNLDDSSDSWEECVASGNWETDQNTWCEETYWPGCGPDNGGSVCRVK